MVTDRKATPPEAAPAERLARRPDEQLVADFRAGRRAALGELAGRYERLLLGLAKGLLGGREDLACDAVQETWVRVIRFAGQFSGGSSFKTWLYRIAINQCRDLQALELRSRNGAPAPAQDPPPGRRLAVRERNESLRAAVAQLEPEKRVIVLLCYHEGMTHERAADVLELPLGTLKSRLHAALEELRSALGAHESRTEAGP